VVGKVTVSRLASARHPVTVLSALALLFAALLSAALAAPAAATMTPADFESCLLDKINEDRASEGVGLLTLAADLSPAVREHSQTMSETEFRHTTDEERAAILPDSVTVSAENIAWSSIPDLADCTSIHDLFMGSPPHAANILNASMVFFAPGVFIDDSGTWVTEIFFDATDYAPAGEGTFWDDDDSMFEDDIEKLVAAGITSGCGEGIFCPNAAVTRGQMAAFLVRALELPDAPAAGFTDTADSAFKADIDKLAAAGITSGCGGGKFCPNDGVTRGQMAAFLNRALALPAAESAGFTDTLGHVFQFDIDRLAGAGITTGCGGTTFCPDQNVTRGQMAAFLVRALGL